MNIIPAILAHLKSERDALDSIIRHCEEVIASREPKHEIPSPVAHLTQLEVPIKVKAARKKPRPSIHSAAFSVLHAECREMTTQQIYNILKADGVKIGGTNPSGALYSILNRHPNLFIKTTDKKWRSHEVVDNDIDGKATGD